MAAAEQQKDDDRVVAVGLLTAREVNMIGAQLSRLYPLEDGGPFAELLDAIDEADRASHHEANTRRC